MINIDFLTLKAFINENIDYLINARIQKIQQPTRKDFIFQLRNLGEGRKLYININPIYYHIAFMSEENEKRRNIVIPKHPPMFCMLLRKYIEGYKITDVNIVNNERIIEFFFEIIDEFSQPRSLVLCIELMGKHSNIILYDRDTKIIIGAAHNIGSEKSRFREIRGGVKYIYPPRIDQNNNYKNKLSNELKLQFQGLSEEKIEKYLTKETYNPAIKNDRYTLFQELIPDSVPEKNVNTMLDNYYSKQQEAINIENEKQHLTTTVNNQFKKLISSEKHINELLSKRDKTKEYQLYGELLTANIHTEQNYEDSITLLNYYSGENITIPLDKTKSLKENANKYYKLYSKAKNTKEKSEAILKDIKMNKIKCQNILYSLEIANSMEELEEISSEITDNNTRPETRISENYLKFKINDFDVFVGKNNKQNDFLISKLAKDEDFWFHTRLSAGSHVVLRTNGKEVDDKTLYECAKLAHKYSSASLSSKVSIIYTKIKYLKKPPGAPLGYVTYKEEKEIITQ